MHISGAKGGQRQPKVPGNLGIKVTFVNQCVSLLPEIVGCPMAPNSLVLTPDPFAGHCESPISNPPAAPCAHGTLGFGHGRPAGLHVRQPPSSHVSCAQLACRPQAQPLRLRALPLPLRAQWRQPRRLLGQRWLLRVLRCRRWRRWGSRRSGTAAAGRRCSDCRHSCLLCWSR